MKIGIQFFVTGYTIDPVTLARAVEDAGFDSFWVPEHATLPVHPTTPYPMTGGAIPSVYGQMADPFVLLSFIGAATTTLKLGTGVCVIPERHPLLLAKEVSTLDNFSGGRVLFGIGTGWAREEIELFGADFRTRWRYTRESVEAMCALWRDGAAGYSGELVNFPPVICDPRPVQRPHPPVLIGGLPSEKTYRRIAAWADGWIAMGVTPDQVADGRKGITLECERLGRDPDTIEISVGVRDADQSVRDAFESAGADRLIVLLYNLTGEAIPMEAWGEAAVTALSGPPPKAADTLRALELIQHRAGL